MSSEQTNNNTKKKRGPKGPYAVEKVIAKLSEDEIKDIRYQYYSRKKSAVQIGKELGLCHVLVPKLIKELGEFSYKDLEKPLTSKESFPA